MASSRTLLPRATSLPLTIKQFAKCAERNAEQMVSPQARKADSTWKPLAFAPDGSVTRFAVLDLIILYLERKVIEVPQWLIPSDLNLEYVSNLEGIFSSALPDTISSKFRVRMKP